jgi:hypothetical protein
MWHNPTTGDNLIWRSGDAKQLQAVARTEQARVVR